jgi:hypothetical protein
MSAAAKAIPVHSLPVLVRPDQRQDFNQRREATEVSNVMDEEAWDAVGDHRGDNIGVVDLFAANGNCADNCEQMLGKSTNTGSAAVVPIHILTSKCLGRGKRPWNIVSRQPFPDRRPVLGRAACLVLCQGFLDHDDSLVPTWSDVRGQAQSRHTVIIHSDSGLNGDHARRFRFG